MEAPAAQLQAAACPWEMCPMSQENLHRSTHFPKLHRLPAGLGVKCPDGCGSFSQGSEIMQNGEFSAILQSQVV